ncbi:MAG: sugar ABC transporter ATP-binding protein [Chloroflexota bacterium]
MKATPVIEARGITKAFPGTLALDRVDFQLLPGEIHALVGENGAGKSTLMLVMSGVHQPDGGELLLDGYPVRPHDPHHAQQLGISTVFQDLALVPNMSVAENVFTNAQPVRPPGFIRFQGMYDATREALQAFGVNIDPRAPLRRYNVAVQQIVEIARAITRQVRVLILDEPTSAIGERETEQLFRVLRMLRDRGIGIIYVSHKLSEVFALADRVTVLKDGKLVGTLPTRETDQDTVVRMMVGRELSQLFPDRDGGKREPILEVRKLSGRGFEEVSLTAYTGEVLGLFGLTGAGRTELARGIFGVEPATGGEILLRGQPIKITNPGRAMAAGIAYIPEDRKRDGLFLEMSLRQNVAAACLRALSGPVFMKPAREEALAREAIGMLQIKASSLEQRASRLSGGNQQKVLFAKWLARRPKVLIADEPTRGIDVGSKAEVHALLRKLADEGAAVVMISSELPEVLGMSDRIAVMREGRLAGIFSRDVATEELIASHALGTVAAESSTQGGAGNVQ